MKNETYSGAITRYAIGGMLAASLTIVMYLMVAQSWLSGMSLALGVVLLAIIQLIVQLYAFLHFGADRRPRWKTWSFAFTMFALVIVVVGSLWIMKNLNYRMMVGPDSMNDYMIQQNKEGF